MRTSDEDYFRTCVAQERRLAHLLGHSNIEELNDSAGVLWEGTRALPQWTRNWGACGPLLARYALCVSYAPDAFASEFCHHGGQSESAWQRSSITRSRLTSCDCQGSHHAAGARATS